MKSYSFNQLITGSLCMAMLIPTFLSAQTVSLPKRQVYVFQENTPVQQVFSFEGNMPRRVKAKIKTARFVRIITLWRDGTDTDSVPKIYEAYLHGDSIKTWRQEYEMVEMSDGEQLLPNESARCFYEYTPLQIKKRDSILQIHAPHSLRKKQDSIFVRADSSWEMSVYSLNEAILYSSANPLKRLSDSIPDAPLPKPDSLEMAKEKARKDSVAAFDEMVKREVGEPKEICFKLIPKPRTTDARIVLQSMMGYYTGCLHLTCHFEDSAAYEISIRDPEEREIYYERRKKISAMVHSLIDLSAYMKGEYRIRITRGKRVISGKIIIR